MVPALPPTAPPIAPPTAPPDVASGAAAPTPIASRRLRVLWAAAEEERARAAAAAGIDDGAAAGPTALVPVNARAVTRLPRRRRRRFRHHVRTLVAAARALDGARLDAAGADPASEAVRTLLARTCATCAGRCCTRGGERAHLDAARVARFRREHPTLDDEGVVRAYMAHVGAWTYDGSCVYHGAQGCTLPRAMRADLCERFACAGLAALRRAVADVAAPRAFVAAHDPTTIVRTAFLP